MLGSYRGSELLGVRYAPPFPYFMDAANSFQVLAADFVSTEDGTGIVHLAPAYGEDDKNTTDPADITPVTPVDAKGRFDTTVADYAGQHVFDANKAIIADLKNATGRPRPTARCWYATRPTSTPTRTAGAAATR